MVAMAIDTREQAPRDRAVQRLKKRRDFRAHLLVYVLVNGFVVLIWTITGTAGFFWPVFLIAAWGIGLVLNAWDVYWRREITEQDIQHEMEREDRHG
jgi:2TM domain-containing protein